MTPEIGTLVFDGPHTGPNGGQMTRIVTLDEHGCEIGWFGIDSGDPSYGPTAEHPDRDFLGWPEGIGQPFSFYNNVDEGWACPSYEDAVHAALLEHATRLDSGWYDDGSECRFADGARVFRKLTRPVPFRGPCALSVGAEPGRGLT